MLFLTTAQIAAQPDAEKRITEKATFIDDLYVRNNACIGQDCFDPASFGLNTLVLNDINCRMLFNDTSSDPFPKNDWLLQANSSVSGGQEYFSIQDVSNIKIPFLIEANARSHAIYVHNSGRIGMGTNNPEEDIHIVHGNTPALRLEQDNSSGFTPQSWDVGGNEVNFFIRDNTFGEKFPFRIRPGAPTSSIEIKSDGTVFISGELEVLSDARLKENIHPISNATSIISQLNSVTYNLKSVVIPNLGLSAEKQYGLIAQELESVIPELVSTNSLSGDILDGMKSVNYIQLIPILIKAIQEQNSRLEQQDQIMGAQNQEILNLKNALELLSARLQTIENR